MRRPINWITVCISITFLLVGLSLAEPRQQRDVHVVPPVAFPLLEQTALRSDPDLASLSTPYAFQPRISSDDDAQPEMDNATFTYSITLETTDSLDVRELAAALEPRRH